MNADAMPKAVQRKMGIGSGAETSLTEGDFFHTSSNFLQIKPKTNGDEMAEAAVEPKAITEESDEDAEIVGGFKSGGNKKLNEKKVAKTTEGGDETTEAAGDVYSGMTAKQETGDKHKARKIMFNVLDINMDGHLSLKEFFDMIKF